MHFSPFFFADIKALENWSIPIHSYHTQICRPHTIPVVSIAPHSSTRPKALFPLHLLSELGVVLLEAVADSLLGGHPLLDATVDAAALARGDGLGGEVVDAGVEAMLHEAAESLENI